ncbi:putative methyltransferase family protein [Zostera marina]|uniref:Putative methyltransferase family protein n=1 Tax=Zostera marina TaxID=29655 RepID=A0A0K9Q3K2_ZOSMR|nr:putative methyltransferase family protein [Zostera marina]
MEDGRLNSSDTSAIMLDILGHQLHLAQDPNSKHLGTTVWDASMVFVKYLEKNCRKGRFSISKLKGKRVIELGAGCGLAGIGMALLGCDVISTDQVEVLPLLMRNIERNTSRILQSDSDMTSFGSINAAELDWGNQDHIKAVDPPFDFIIGTDVVYSEHLLDPLLQTIFALAGPRTTILLGYEIRSTMVHDQMIDMWKSNFNLKSIPRSKMDVKYQHPSIQLFAMDLKSRLRSEKSGNLNNCEGNSCSSEESVSDMKDDKNGIDEDSEHTGIKECDDDLKVTLAIKNGKLDGWESRRHGSFAARLLKDVKIT